MGIEKISFVLIHLVRLVDSVPDLVFMTITAPGISKNIIYSALFAIESIICDNVVL